MKLLSTIFLSLFVLSIHAELPKYCQQEKSKKTSCVYCNSKIQLLDSAEIVDMKSTITPILNNFNPIKSKQFETSLKQKALMAIEKYRSKMPQSFLSRKNLKCYKKYHIKQLDNSSKPLFDATVEKFPAIFKIKLLLSEQAKLKKELKDNTPSNTYRRYTAVNKKRLAKLKKLKSILPHHTIRLAAIDMEIKKMAQKYPLLLSPINDASVTKWFNYTIKPSPLFNTINATITDKDFNQYVKILNDANLSIVEKQQHLNSLFAGPLKRDMTNRLASKKYYPAFIENYHKQKKQVNNNIQTSIEELCNDSLQLATHEQFVAEVLNSPPYNCQQDELTSMCAWGQMRHCEMLKKAKKQQAKTNSTVARGVALAGVAVGVALQSFPVVGNAAGTYLLTASGGYLFVNDLQKYKHDKNEMYLTTGLTFAELESYDKLLKSKNQHAENMLNVGLDSLFLLDAYQSLRAIKLSSKSNLVKTSGKIEKHIILRDNHLPTSAWQKAEDFFKRKLTMSEKFAIEDAHAVGFGEIGKDGTAAKLGNFTKAQLRQKNRILKQAGFSKQEIRALMKNNIVGMGGSLDDLIKTGKLADNIPSSLAEKVGPQELQDNLRSVLYQYNLPMNQALKARKEELKVLESSTFKKLFNGKRIKVLKQEIKNIEQAQDKLHALNVNTHHEIDILEVQRDKEMAAQFRQESLIRKKKEAERAAKAAQEQKIREARWAKKAAEREKKCKEVMQQFDTSTIDYGDDGLQYVVLDKKINRNMVEDLVYRGGKNNNTPTINFKAWKKKIVDMEKDIEKIKETDPALARDLSNDLWKAQSDLSIDDLVSRRAGYQGFYLDDPEVLEKRFYVDMKHILRKINRAKKIK